MKITNSRISSYWELVYKFRILWVQNWIVICLWNEREEMCFHIGIHFGKRFLNTLTWKHKFPFWRDTVTVRVRVKETISGKVVFRISYVLIISIDGKVGKTFLYNYDYIFTTLQLVILLSCVIIIFNLFSVLLLSLEILYFFSCFTYLSKYISA